MKILYIRNKEDGYFKSFISSDIIIENNIYLLDLKNREFTDYNSGKVIHLLGKSKFYNRKIINYISRFIAALAFLIKFKHYSFDICHILNIKRENFWVIRFLKKRTKKIIITVYGRSTYLFRIKRFLFKFVYNNCDVFTFQNLNTLEEFHQYNPKIDTQKLVELLLPIEQIDYVKNLSSDDKSALYEKLNLKKDLIHISCSSTISAYDQHFKVINELSKIKNKEKVQLMFLLTYGGKKEYKQQVIEKIKHDLSEFEVGIFDRFLTSSDLASYRMCTDIYINMRTTDNIAGAILETLKAGSFLLSASWLKYNVLDKLGVYYKKVNTFSELAPEIDYHIEKFQELKSKYSQTNSSIIEQNCSHKAIIHQWVDLYNKLNR